MSNNPNSGQTLMEPRDEHNEALIRNVHPQDWINPEPAERYHLVVIGAGTAGLVSAAIAAGVGAKVALVERHLMGGDCLNVGCVPSKGVISAARAWRDARRANELFGAPEVAAAGAGDFAHAMARMRKIRADISEIDGAARFRDLGIDVFIGQGRFTGEDTVEVDGEDGKTAKLNFRRAVIATGGRATAPPIPGLAEAGYLTNETVFSLTELPKRFGVIGAGPIGCELAQSFARFGAEVMVFDVADRVLPREDPDASAIVQKAMNEDGVRFHLGAQLNNVERKDNVTTIQAKTGDGDVTVEVDALLVAAGRQPNVDGLGLEKAGVEHTKKGVTVDDNLKTTNPEIFAVGDIASKYQFTHVADAQARMVIRNAFFFGSGKASQLVIPWATYTSPEVAHVGLYEEEARQQGYEVQTITIGMDDVDRAKLDGEDEGFLRVHLKKGTDQILGGTLVAAHAGDMIGLLSLAITQKIGLGKFGDTIFPYPTQGEIFRKAGDAYNKTRLTPTAKKLFKRWFGVFK